MGFEGEGHAFQVLKWSTEMSKFFVAVPAPVLNDLYGGHKYNVLWPRHASPLQDMLSYWIVLKFYPGGDVQSEIDTCRETPAVTADFALWP